MTPQEQQIIESLMQRLTQAAAQAGPRDPEAEALIQQRLQSFPGGPYYMAQTLILQERALQQAEARLGQQGGQGSFLPGGGQPYPGAPAGYPPAGYPPPYDRQPQGGGMGGFLAGAGKLALGIGGGILVAEAASGLARDLFGQRDYDGGFDRDQGPFDGYESSQDQSYDQQADSDTSGDFGDLGDSGDSGGQDW